jgi:hypothetical protein
MARGGDTLTRSRSRHWRRARRDACADRLRVAQRGHSRALTDRAQSRHVRPHGEGRGAHRSNCSAVGRKRASRKRTRSTCLAAGQKRGCHSNTLGRRHQWDRPRSVGSVVSAVPLLEARRIRHPFTREEPSPASSKGVAKVTRPDRANRWAVRGLGATIPPSPPLARCVHRLSLPTRH